MKTTKYRICWKSLIHEGVGGKGEELYDLETAESRMKQLDNKFPQIKRYLQPVEVEEETK